MAEENWHPADIGAALKKRGHSLSGLSIANGYHRWAAGKALAGDGANYRGGNWRGAGSYLAEPLFNRCTSGRSTSGAVGFMGWLGEG